MTISLGQEDKTQVEAAKRIAAALLGRAVVSAETIGGGRNSRVYRIETQGGKFYAAKFYFQHPGDKRDRAGVEFNSLQFLWNNGVRCIPEPIRADVKDACAIYGFIDGEKIVSSAVSAQDITVAVNFLATLKDLRGKARGQDFAPASEACFSAQALFDNLEKRFNRLLAVQGEGEEYQWLHDFLKSEYLPFLQHAIEQTKKELEKWGIAFTEESSASERTLSPSDFGFHNALRRPDGSLVFLDFEYFGWDDPVKMISDFLLHPGMSLSEASQQQFAKEIYQVFGEYRNLAQRVQLFYPLWSMKWTLILLNEFVPKDMLRRGFAQGELGDRKKILKEQLHKAQKMLRTVKEYYESTSHA